MVKSFREALMDWAPIIVLALFVVICVGFASARGVIVSEDKAVRAMESAGYTQVEVVDKAWFAVGFRGCDKNDTVRFTVTAENPAGDPVEVYVCASFLKGGTIRQP